MMYDGADSM